MFVSINGKIFSGRSACVSVTDHGFLYGDSVYETIRTFNGNPFLIREHLKRLRRSARALEIPCPGADDSFTHLMRKLSRRVKSKELIFRIIVTRGKGKIGYKLDRSQKPTVVIMACKFRGFAPLLYRTGITLITSKVRRSPPDSLDPAIKSSNLLSLRMAYIEASEKGGHEALLRNPAGEIAECASSSIFFVKQGHLLTPSLDSGILKGITRELVITLAKDLDIPVTESTLLPEIAGECDECFITSTIKSILPVRQIDGRLLGDPGEITERLMKAFKSNTARF